MKKVYSTPSVEVVKFQYRDQVVAASGGCTKVWINQDLQGQNRCTDNNSFQDWHGNQSL